VPHKDLRDWLTQVEELGELKVVEGVHWDLEIGVITEELFRRRGPALVFDGIPGYPKGYWVLVNALGSPKRLAFTLGLPPDRELRKLLKPWREKSHSLKPIPMKYVEDGPVMENVYFDQDVDVLKFPAPKWHEYDGGRYIGTGSVDITVDPEEGWVNLGTYRVMIHDRNHVGFYISPGKQGRMHRERWFAKKEKMPVAISIGHDPLIYLAGGLEIPYGLCEYDWIGGVKGERVEVIKGRITGLPIPAHAEIVLEGFADPSHQLPEGPFGEWTGYYASGERAEPVIEVKAVYHRNDPIILGSPPGKPPTELHFYRAFLRSVAIQEQLEKAGIPGVKGVWCHEVGESRLFTVVAIEQRYAGHAKQAGVVASQCQAGAYLGRFVVVDDDIDIMDLNDVMWAVCTRVDPAQDIDILHRCWSGPLDPMLSPSQRERKEFFNSRAIIDATRPFEWRDRFPRVSESSPQVRERILNKWAERVFS